MAARINFSNRTLYHGDNLDFLRGINSETIHLIATDPPFNKGRDFHATPGSLAEGAKFKDRWSWEKDVHEAWTDQIQDDWPKVWWCIEYAREAHSDGMGAFICFLAVRMIEMHRILRRDGSIFLHCDPTASHYIKALMDAIFSPDHFRNELMWCYSGGGLPKNDYPRKHDVILRYAKSDTWIFNVERKQYADSTKEVGIHSTSSGKNNAIDLEKGTPVTDWWTDIKAVTGWAGEKLGYPTQKPLALYERIVKAATDEGQWVLDPFCGCATTPVAAERLGRKWIGMDFWDQALGVLTYRFQKEHIKMADAEETLRQFLAELTAKQKKSVGETKMLDQVKALLQQPTIPGIERGTIKFTSEPPVRTGNGKKQTPIFRTPERTKAEPRQSRKEMFELLLEKNGLTCPGCDYEVRGPWDFHLDHINPRAAGGGNEIANRTLLCGPCNQTKGSDLTIVGLRKKNKKLGRMAA